MSASSPQSSKGSPSRLQALKAAKKAALKAGGGSPHGSPSSEIVRDPFEKALEAKSVIHGNTGLMVDGAMRLHRNPWDAEHIESPERLAVVEARIREWGLWDRCIMSPARLATPAEIERVHTAQHWAQLEALGQQSVESIRQTCQQQFQTIYMNEDSMRAARLAAGGFIDLVQAISQGRWQNGMALVRPPGHHAMKAEANGFCLLNTVAIAAQDALHRDPHKKILIVDFDVHHGQGTQQLFYEDPRVLFMSMHRYESGEFCPHLRESQFDYIGQLAGQGFNVNIPLNEKHLHDVDYLNIFHQIVLPLAYEFEPSLVLVSAGFDAALGCPEGEMCLTPPVFGHMVQSLMSLAYGNVAVLLEGGYFLESLADGAAFALKALLGDDPVRLGPMDPLNESVFESILNVISAHRDHWTMFPVQEEYNISDYDPSTSEDCHEPLILYRGDSYLEARALNMGKTEPEDCYAKHTPEKHAELMAQLTEIRKTYPNETLTSGGMDIKRVALTFDELMTRHSNLEEPNHPERPGRVLNIYKSHDKFGLLDRSNLTHLPSRRATAEEIFLCHDAAHYEAMSQIPEKTQDELESLAGSFDSIYMNPDTFDCALLSCGNLLNVVDAVMDGRAKKGVAIIRPPGHHAESDEPCGFCLFNNVAIAAKYAIEYQQAKRVLILDWDVHHGNGIQNMFYDNPNVLYISLHRFDNGTFFPSRMDANYDYCGENQGEGFNINIPWNGAGMGDPEYSLALFNIILPVGYEFNPDLVLISAGFDAAQGDPLGKCCVTPEMYGHFVHHLQRLAQGRVIVALEGGYNLNSIALSMTMCTKALLGDPLPPVSILKRPKTSAVESIRNVMRTHARYWDSLKFGLKKVPDSFEELKVQAYSSPTKKVTQQIPIDMSKSPHGAKFESLYIPSEYGHFSDCHTVNTISSSAHSSDGIQLVDSKRRPDGGDSLASNFLTTSLGNLQLDNSTSEATRTSPSRTDYYPFQFGNNNYSSPSVNTITKTVRTNSSCAVVDTTKKTDEPSS
ncbi:histone deacetylase 6-like [Tigriopus californicus]|nr:histone deacetylase 6-like [Tigriopus californicus]|eukprot:TCALIF_04174-PA protein Name:"Similar to hda-6 Histone deacetylase 6 (Caenorhabditis elegans)" AED:0.06 eAED:0.06 QI:68/1/1/1/1/1/2/455/1015